MHDLDRTQQYLEAGEFEADREMEYEPEADYQPEVMDQEGSMADSLTGEIAMDTEIDLAAELVGVTNDQELDQFLGNFIKRIGKTFRGFGRSGLGRSLFGALRGVAKAALPTLGGALGSFIPIPGVGTALGAAAGNALGGALELEGMSSEDREFEIARRIVRMGLDTAQQLADSPQEEVSQDELLGTLLNVGKSLLPGAVGSLLSGGGGLSAAGAGQGQAGAGGSARIRLPLGIEFDGQFGGGGQYGSTVGVNRQPPALSPFQPMQVAPGRVGIGAPAPNGQGPSRGQRSYPPNRRGPSATGRWIRRGGVIIVLGAY